MPNITRGVAPGFLLIPARDYSWELVRRVQLRLPNTGSIRAIIDQGVLDKNVSFPGEDEFSLFEDNVLLLWEVVRVLFASAQYPQLSDDECLNVVALEIAGDEIVLSGEIIKVVNG